MFWVAASERRGGKRGGIGKKGRETWRGTGRGWDQGAGDARLTALRSWRAWGWGCGGLDRGDAEGS